MVLFYHALIGISLAAAVILGEHWITGNDFRIYTWTQYGTILLCCVFDFIALNCQTVAFQSDSSGFVSLIGYMAVLYAFIVDYLVFHESISLVEICGAILILTVTILVSVKKIRDQNLLSQPK